MKYWKSYICCLVVMIFMVGCVHTNVSRRTEKIDRTYSEDVPEEVIKKMEETDPQFYTVTIAEGSGKVTMGYELQSKDGSPYKMKEPPAFVINGLTGGAKFWQVVGGTVNTGANIFGQSVQGYYGRKTQDIDISQGDNNATLGPVTQNN